MGRRATLRGVCSPATWSIPPSCRDSETSVGSYQEGMGVGEFTKVMDFE